MRARLSTRLSIRVAALTFGVAPAMAIVLAAGPAAAVPGGDLTVLPKGHYACEIPGDPSDPALFGGTPKPDSDFDVVGDSSYRTRGVRGIYLMTGDMVRFTTGPLQGSRYHRVNTTFLRAVGPDGKDGDLRCVNSIQAQAPEQTATSRCRRKAAERAAQGAAQKVALERRDEDPPC